MSLLIVGSIALDDVKTPYGMIENGLGGSAVYSSIAASYFFSASIIGVVGKDFSEEYIAVLKERGIDVNGIETKDGKTFHWKGYYEGDMNSANTLDTELNVFAAFDPVLTDEDKSKKFVFLANIDPVLQLKILDDLKKPDFVMLDTMNYWIGNKKKELVQVIEKVDMVVVNDAEARQLTGEVNLLKAAEWMQNLGPKGVIIKKGEHGAIVFWEDKKVIIPAFPLKDVCDPTGAGDTYAGAFIGALCKRGEVNIETIHSSAAYGSILASFVVQDFSVKKSAYLTKKEIDERFLELKKMMNL